MILDEIIKKTKEDLKNKKAKLSLDDLGKSLSLNYYMPKDAISFIRRNNEEKIKIIPEIKEKSFNKNFVKEDFFPTELAVDCEKNGASAISIVTEPNFFSGSIDYIPEVRRYTQIPILRKDFIIDKYQIIESLVYGADFILLIAKALSKKELKELLEYTYYVGLQAVVECHDVDDVKKAIFSGAEMIEINHRNLYDLTLDMNLSEKLISIIPNGKVIISQGGISSYEQVSNLEKIGIDACLIGEYLMFQEDIGLALKNLKRF